MATSAFPVHLDVPHRCMSTELVPLDRAPPFEIKGFQLCGGNSPLTQALAVGLVMEKMPEAVVAHLHNHVSEYGFKFRETLLTRKC
jgi:hypothetical protein